MKLHRKHILFLSLVLCFAAALPASASAPYALSDSANAAYAKGNYAKAITFYNKFLSSGYVSADVYYNLGNSYYRSNEIGLAILNYERAKKLAPDNADILFNLQLANQRTTDKINAGSQLVFLSWWSNFVNMASEKGWGIISIIFLCLTLTLVVVYLFSPRPALRQMGFWGGLFMLFLCVSSFMLANTQYKEANNHNTAIVMSASVTVKGAPSDSATQLFVIHEGTKVQVLRTNGNWVEVKLANGNQGWMPASGITVI